MSAVSSTTRSPCGPRQTMEVPRRNTPSATSFRRENHRTRPGAFSAQRTVVSLSALKTAISRAVWCVKTFSLAAIYSP